MNILVDPIFHPLFQALISILLIFGSIEIGNQFSQFFFKKPNFWFLNLLVGIILISQTAYIFIIFSDIIYIITFFSYFLLLFGIYNLFFLFKKKKLYKKNLNLIDYLIIIVFFLLFIISTGPPTMADALDYHYGVSNYLVNFNNWPATNLWLSGSLAGNGEVFSSLAIFLGSDNLGGMVQSISLIAFCFFITNDLSDLNKARFIKLFIISSPVLIFLVSGPKFQLFPQILTATAIYLTFKKKKILKEDFQIICMLLIGATQFKLSFVLSGIPIGIFALFRISKFNKQIILYLIILFCFFFIPRGIWNLQQVSEPNVLSFFTPLPNSFLNLLQQFRENNYFFPINLFIPNSLGAFTTILGFQIFLIFLIKKLPKEFKEIIFLSLIVSFLQFIFGASIARTFYETILWISVGFIFVSSKNFKFLKISYILCIQTICVLIVSFYGFFLISPSLIDKQNRDKVMVNYAYEYAGIKWLNKVLPKNAIVLSDLRSVSLLNRQFVPTDWLKMNHKKPYNDLEEYFAEIKQKKVNFIVIKDDNSKNHPLYKCFTNLFLKSEEFKDAKRNPFNISNSYTLKIYGFDYKKLNYCVQN